MKLQAQTHEISMQLEKQNLALWPSALPALGLWTGERKATAALQ